MVESKIVGVKLFKEFHRLHRGKPLVVGNVVVDIANIKVGIASPIVLSLME